MQQSHAARQFLQVCASFLVSFVHPVLSIISVCLFVDYLYHDITLMPAPMRHQKLIFLRGNERGALWETFEMVIFLHTVSNNTHF